MKRHIDPAASAAKRLRSEPVHELPPVLLDDLIAPVLAEVLRCPDDRLAGELRACLHHVRNVKFVCRKWNALVPQLLARPAPPFSPVLAASLYWNQIRHLPEAPSRVASLTGVLVTEGHADARALRRLASQIRGWQHLVSSHCPPEFIDFLLAGRNHPVSFKCAVELTDADHLDRTLQLVEQAKQRLQLYMSPERDYQPGQDEMERMVARLVEHDWKGVIKLRRFPDTLVTALDGAVESGQLLPESVTGFAWRLTQGTDKVIEADTTPLLPVLYPATRRLSFNRSNSPGLTEVNVRRLLGCIAELKDSDLEELDIFVETRLTLQGMRQDFAQAFEVTPDLKRLFLDGLCHGADNNPEALIETIGKLKKMEECLLHGNCLGTPSNTINVLPFTGLLPHLPALKRLSLPVLRGTIDRVGVMHLLRALLHHPGLERVELYFSSIENAATFGNIARGDDDHAQSLMARFSMGIEQQGSLGVVNLIRQIGSSEGFTLPRRQ